MMLCSTRIGKTWGNAIMAVLVAILFSGEEVVNIAPTYKQAFRMFKRIKSFFINDARLKQYVDIEKGFRLDEINLINGSVLRCLSAHDPESLLGFGATTLIVDEAGSIEDETYKTRIIRMVASSGAYRRNPILVLIGTPHHLNHFHESYLSGEFRVFKYTWKAGVEAGILDQKVVDYAKRTMSEAEFDCWFNAEFQPDESAMFDIRMVRDRMTAAREKAPMRGYDYYGGLDIARMGTDETALVIMKIPSGLNPNDADVPVTMVAEYCRAKRPINDTVGWAKKIMEQWKLRYLAVDELNIGGGVFDLLHEEFGDKIVGLKLVGDERIEVYSNLLDMIENKRLSLIPTEKLAYQFSSYSLGYQSNGKRKISKNPDMHDDLVDACAFAAYMLRRDSGGIVEVFELGLKF